jgi:two-component system KDP operon response regulator KdpE
MTEPKPRILAVEDEPPLRRFLSVTLDANGYDVIEAQTLREALERSARERPDLILLDLGLPDGDGMELVRKVREWSHAPIIVLSAREKLADKIQVLDMGADDYLTKPFGVGELLARLRVALRHSARLRAGTDAPVFAAGDVRIDLERRLVFRKGAEVRLTPIEFRILSVLVQCADQVVTHKHLLASVWGAEHNEHVHYLRVYMAQLRQKLEADSNRPQLLLTESGIGYRLKSE